jgi:cellulose synthase operon protein YhjQ
VSDVLKLLHAIGIPDFEYREVGAVERWQSAAARWPVFEAANRALLEQKIAAPSPESAQPQPRVHNAHFIALASLQGGAGRTTLAANLTAALAHDGRSAVALELDPQGSLALHFGTAQEESPGALQPSLTQQAAAAWLSRFRSGPGVFPFGKLTAGLQTSLEQTLARDPKWLPKRLAAVLPEDLEYVVIDLPVATHPLFRAAAGMADTLIAVLTPEPPAYASMPQLEELLAECAPRGGRPAVRYLLNRFDAGEPFHRDFFASLRGMMGERVLPFPVHADRAVQEAAARRHLLVQEAADSQVMAELARLAEFCEEVAKVPHLGVVRAVR